MNVIHRKIIFAIIFVLIHKEVTLVHVDRDTKKQVYVVTLAQVWLIFLLVISTDTGAGRTIIGRANIHIFGFCLIDFF